jgi:hypothetical protein
MAQNFPGGHELLNGACAGLALRGTLLIGASIEIHYAGSAEEGELALQFIELFSGQALVSFAGSGRRGIRGKILAVSPFIRFGEFSTRA